MIGLELDEAAAVLDEALDAIGLELMMAAKRDPFTRAGFDAMVGAVASEAARAMAQAQRDALRRAAPLLRRDWTGLDGDRLELAIAEVTSALRTGLESGAPAVAAVFGRAWSQTAAEAWDASVEVYGFRRRGTRLSEIAFAERRGSRWSTGQPDPVFEGLDPEVSEHARTSSQFYIRDAMGRIVDGPVAQSIRDKVAEGIRDGLDQRTIASDLSKLVSGTTAARSRDYLVMASSVATARARSYGVLKSFEEAAISYTEFRAVLDEVTSQVCRFMHKRRFEVRAQLQRFDYVARAPLGAVKALQPFMRVGRTQDGERAVGVRDLGTNSFVPFASVTRSGLGVKDDPGEFRTLVSDARMQALGCCTPPLHPHCRSILVPGRRPTVQVPGAAPEPPAAAPVAPATPTRAPAPTQPRQAPASPPARAPWQPTPAGIDDEPIEVIPATPPRPGVPVPPTPPGFVRPVAQTPPAPAPPPPRPQPRPAAAAPPVAPAPPPPRAPWQPRPATIDDDLVEVTPASPPRPGVPVPPPPVVAPAVAAPLASPPSPPPRRRRSGPVGPFEVRTVRGRPLIGPKPDFHAEGADVVTDWRSEGAYINTSGVDLERVFGKGKVPKLKHLGEAWGDPESGALFVLQSVSSYGNAVSFSGVLKRAGTGEVLNTHTISRSFRRDGRRLYVGHDYMVLKDDDQLTGPPIPKLGSRLVRNSVRLYSHLGAESVEVHPAWMGQFVWPSMGFTWEKPSQASAVQARFEAFLRARGFSDAAEIARARGKHPWDISDFDTGERVEVRDGRPGSSGKMLRLPLGKLFFYNSGPGTLILNVSDASSESFRRLKRKVLDALEPK